MKIYINLLFLLGIFLLFIGIVTIQIINSSSAVIVTTIVIGIGCIIASLVLFVSTSKGFWQMRYTEVATNGIVSATSIVLIIILINFLAIKYPLKIDLTENQLFTLSPQTQQLVKNLPAPLQVYVFDRPINEIDKQILEDYQAINNLFEYQFVDPQVDISLAQKFNVTRNGDVYLEYENRSKLVQIVSAENRLSEVKLTEAIAFIQKENQATISILQGNGEPLLQQGGETSFAQLVESLSQRGYIVEPLNLTTSPLVPPTTNILLVSDGEGQLSQVQKEKIEQYIDRGGNLLLMSNAQSTNSLGDILNQWGINLNDSLAIDSSGTGDVFGFGPSISIILNYNDHPITTGFDEGLVILPWAKPIITTAMANIETTPLLITTNQSWGETDLEEQNVEFNPTEDIPPPLVLAVASVKTKTEESTSTPENQSQQEVEPNIDTPPTSTQTPPDLALGGNDLPEPPDLKTPNQPIKTSNSRAKYYQQSTNSKNDCNW